MGEGHDDSPEEAGESRDRIAERRDRTAEAHDQRSEARDVEAETRDERAEIREGGSRLTDSGAEADRASARQDRKEGASDRTHSSHDRQAALLDRLDAASDREEATADQTLISTDDLTGAYARGPGYDPEPGQLRGLLQRDSQLEKLVLLAAKARSGIGSICIIEGQPGLGKTALLDAAGELAVRSGMRLFRGQGTDLEVGVSFGLTLQLFERCIAEATPSVRKRVFQGAATHAEGLFGDRAELRAPDRELVTLLHGLYLMAANLASEGPMVLIVDDAHFADIPSLRFLLYLSHRISGLPVLALVGAREERSPINGRLIDQLAQAPSTESLALSPLDPAGSAELIRSYVPSIEPTFSETCAQLGGGNPLLLHELMKEVLNLEIDPVDDQADRVLAIVPRSISRIVATRLGRTSTEAADLANALSVLGSQSTLGRAGALSRLGPQQLSAAIDELREAAILAADGPPRFLHPLLESSVRAAIPEGERSRVHLRAIEILIAQDASAEHIAPHLLNTMPAGDSLSVELLRAAAERSMTAGAPEPATRFLARALDEPPSDEDRATLLLELGEAEARAGHPSAIGRISEALTGMSPGPERLEGMVSLAQVQYAEGRPRDAAATLDQALLGIEDSEQRLRLESERFAIAVLDPELNAQAFAHAKALSDQIEGNPESPGSRSLHAAIALQMGLSGSDRPRAVALAEQAYSAGALLTEEGPSSNTLGHCTVVMYMAGEFERDAEIASATIDEARRRGDVQGFATASYARSGPMLKMGQIREAIADAEAALDPTDYGWAQFLPPAYGILVNALLLHGDLEGAKARIGELDPERWSATAMWPLAHGAKANILIAEGELEQAFETLIEQGELMPWPNPALLGHWRSDAALVACRLGRLDDAHRLATDELELTQRWGAPGPIGLSLRALGAVEAARTGSTETLAKAVSVLDGTSAILDSWQARLDLGRSLRVVGRRKDARVPLRRVAKEASKAGAVRLASAAHDELDLSGAKPRRRALSGVDSLTPGELRVVRMAAQGMTNRAIAEALFVTVKAVQWHLRNSYRKLDVTRREDLAAIVPLRAASASE